MPDKINSSTNQPPAQIEADLIALLRRYAPILPSHACEHSMLDDAIDGPAGAALGRERCEEIVHAEFARVRSVARAKVDEAMRCAEAAERADPVKGQPELPATDDGLSEALRLAAWELRWNTRASWPEARRVGTDEWLHCTETALDDVFNDCSKVATVRRGAMPVPWHLTGPRMERRLIGVVARRRPEVGEGSAVFEAVTAWASDKPGVRLSFGEVLGAAGCLNRYESGVRVPESVAQAAKAALRDLGWEWKKARRPGESARLLWCAPGVPKGADLRPSAYIRRVK